MANDLTMLSLSTYSIKLAKSSWSLHERFDWPVVRTLSNLALELRNCRRSSPLLSSSTLLLPLFHLLILQSELALSSHKLSLPREGFFSNWLLILILILLLSIQFGISHSIRTSNTKGRRRGEVKRREEI